MTDFFNEARFVALCKDILEPFVEKLASDNKKDIQAYIKLEIRKQLNTAFSAAEYTTTER